MAIIHERERLRALVTRLRENLIDQDIEVDDLRAEIATRETALPYAIDARNRTARHLANAITDLAQIESTLRGVA